MVTIETAPLQDICDIVKLERLCFAGDPFPASLFRKSILSETAEIRIAKVEGRIIGFCLLVWPENESLMTLGDLVIHPDFRRQGIGQQLLAAAEDFAREKCRYFITLEVRISNTGAIRLYERNGYQFHQELATYYPDGETAIRYVKFLMSEI